MRQAPESWIRGDPTLLVIEDAQEGAELIRVAARRAWPLLDVRVAGDGREGIAYLAGTPPFQYRWAHPLPDLVILDLVMPEVDGFDVLEWMRTDAIAAGIPVVVLTGSTDPEHEERCRALGACDFFRKPDEAGTLGALVGDIIRRRIADPENEGSRSQEAS